MVKKMPELAISRAKLLDIYRDRARTRQNLGPYFGKFFHFQLFISFLFLDL
jgi:hypothetical protein